jgi:hypothetical protein
MVMPRLTLSTDMPGARATAATPPRPNASASAAANSRFCPSSSFEKTFLAFELSAICHASLDYNAF